MSEGPDPERADDGVPTVGFLINPIAGMGGRIGLKGTDGLAEKAMALGAEPVAEAKAARCLRHFRSLREHAADGDAVRWLTAAGPMGADALAASGVPAERIETVHTPARPTAAADTLAAAEILAERGVRVILFCGGDGTARDIAGVVGMRAPVLGIPSGVKMFSGLFGASPEKAAEILAAFLDGEIETATVEVLDLDEDAYRAGRWKVRLYREALTPFEPTLTQPSKMVVGAASDQEVQADIAAHLKETVCAAPGLLLLLGPGSTVHAIKRAFGIEGTLLGIDAVVDGAVVGADLDERRIVALLDRYPDRRLILSPIGAQGFVLGRGNLQISPEVIRRIGGESLIVVATPAKLAHTPVLRFDTGEPALDEALRGKGYLPVVTGYGTSRMVKVAD